jgi:predicted porin
MKIFGAIIATLLVTAGAAAAQQGTYSIVTCVSDGERRHCPADTSAGIMITRSTGTSTCLLGRNWGYDARGVWVTEGCGGEFIVAGTAEVAGTAQSAVVAEPVPEPVPEAVPEQEARDDEAGGFSVYTRFGAITAVTQDEVEVQDNGSRVRFEYATGDDIRFFAKGEWAINLTGARTDFNPGESTASGFLLLERTTGDVLGPRLGYVGVDFGDAGRLILGKQWSVHYDIAGYTDAFNTFGAEASATFTAATDGGILGTGRADSALVYRNTFFDFLHVGAQMQMRSVDNDELIDSVGLSLRARVLPGVEAGFAYNRAYLNDSLKGAILSLDGDPEYRIAGVKYAGDSLTLAAVYARQTNGDLARVPVVDAGNRFLVPEVFDADGIEVFGRYQIGSLGILGGFLNYKPDLDENNLLIDPSAELRYYILGFDYLPNPRTRLYAEYRFADGFDATGVPGEDVFVLGAKYEFLLDGLIGN